MRGPLLLFEYSLGCIHSRKLLICLHYLFEKKLVGWCFSETNSGKEGDGADHEAKGAGTLITILLFLLHLL
jgi:hypothetical protein